MKTKYQRMTKEEKKQLLKEYEQTEKGSYILKKLRNVMIVGILSYLYAIYLIITSDSIAYYISAGVLLVIACIFIILSIRLKTKNLTMFAVRKK